MTLFDPDTGKLKDPEGLRSVGFSGESLKQPKVVPSVNEITGGPGGTTTEHASGRVDVNVFAQAVQAGVASPI